MEPWPDPSGAGLPRCSRSAFSRSRSRERRSAKDSSAMIGHGDLLLEGLSYARETGVREAGRGGLAKHDREDSFPLWGGWCRYACARMWACRAGRESVYRCGGHGVSFLSGAPVHHREPLGPRSRRTPSRPPRRPTARPRRVSPRHALQRSENQLLLVAVRMNRSVLQPQQL